MSQDNWCTPPKVTIPLAKFFRGPVGLDPCSNDVSIVKARRRFTAGGLHLPWSAATIYKNEPYSSLLPWMLKTVEELKIPYRGKRKELVGLEPVATSTEWWDVALSANPLLVFTKRISFLDETGMKQMGARFDTVLMVWVNGKRREEQFLDTFAPIIVNYVHGRDWRSR